jgi:hypothetical protein
MPSQIVSSGHTAGKAWQKYGGPGAPGIYLDIDTSIHAFPQTPTYTAALYGNDAHWATTGVTSIYNAKPTGFRVYVRFSDGAALTPELAQANGWYIRWQVTYYSYTYPQGPS